MCFISVLTDTAIRGLRRKKEYSIRELEGQLKEGKRNILKSRLLRILLYSFVHHPAVFINKLVSIISINQ